MTEVNETTDPAFDISSSDRRKRLQRENSFAESLPKWRKRNRYYYRLQEQAIRKHIPAGATVLHVGCQMGDLLAAVGPSSGIGISLSGKVIELARKAHPQLTFEVRDPQQFAFEQTFDFIVIDTALADLSDVQACLDCARRVSHPSTRLLLAHHNALWEPILRLATALGLRRETGEQNWLGQEDFDSLLKLTDFEVVSRSAEILLPVNVPLLSTFLNLFVCKFWPFYHLALTQLVVSRPCTRPSGSEEMTCTVVIPTRNERGNVANAIRRLPRLGTHTEVIFVDGNSTDGTTNEINRVIEANPDRDIKLIPQGDGIGKGDAVRKAFAAATGDVLMILDADLTVPPEDLPRFFQAIADGTGEFINGTRLVYPMEKGAMRVLNKVGNRFFSLLLSWIIGQRLRDTLCGTKALTRRNYETIAANRSFFGDFDPFGDFDLLFGAAKANLKIVEIPVRYRARTYGTTNISRFRHGWLLLKMSWFAFWRLKLR